MNAQGNCTPGGPLTVSHIPLPAPRTTGTDAITHYNQRPDRDVAPSLDAPVREMRAWAIANGFEVNPRGAIPSRVRNAYEQEAKTQPNQEKP